MATLGLKMTSQEPKILKGKIMKTAKRVSSKTLLRIATNLMHIPQLVRLFNHARGVQNKTLVRKAFKIMKPAQRRKFTALAVAQKVVTS